MPQINGIGAGVAVEDRVSLADVAPCTPPCPILRPDLTGPELALVNQHRALIPGARQLVIDSRLQACAEWKAQSMAADEYMDHNDHGAVERTVGQRFAVYYPTNAAWGENIAYGYTDGQSLLQAFLSDPPHKANVESGSWVACGLACAQDKNGTLFWVQDYGSLDPAPPNPPPPPPPASRLALWEQDALPHLEVATGTWKSWHRLQPADFNAVQAWLANTSLPLPTPSSEYGKFVVATLRILTS